MKRIGEILETATTPKSKYIGKRHLIVGEIAEKLAETSFKKVSIKALGKILSKYKTEEELYELHSNCKQARNYSALFWHIVKK